MKIRILASLTVAAVLGLGSLSQADSPVRMSAGQTPATMTNQELADAVASQLNRQNLRGYTIDIICTDGKVELTGRVADGVQRIEVVRSALAVPGVKSVVDNLEAANFSTIRTVQLAQPDSKLPAPLAGEGPIVDPIPVTNPMGAAGYDMNPPKLPPYSWPTYAPYNNYSRVAYPQNYPYNAWPFIGPFHPFPKVPLGWRSVTLEWQDGHWFYGRNATKHDYWRVRYW